MNAASRTLYQVTLSLDFAKKLPPLNPYEGLDSSTKFVYRDQISWITNYAENNICPPRVLFEAKSTTWQKMLENLETVNRTRHPNVSEEYIQWRSQDMLVRRLWPAAKFPGADPDELYTYIRRKYCSAARKLVGERDERGIDYTDDLVKLNITYNEKLSAARKANVSEGGLLQRLCGIQAKQSQDTAGQIEAEDEFVVVEKEDEGVREERWVEGDWNMI
ncbi:hypothetical protein EYC80_003408 [Monilinia laxa]|uniref:Uncharacterized protein n=1 Tax=Monilinia laxa TaxID=61186 RepID=A0A5N6KDZ6_MONLA|nr:hypothetical protein EYC80_003408 [Monilinia laxa]